MEGTELLPPPSYGSMFNDQRTGLSYIDFLPVAPGTGFLSRQGCGRFGTLVDGANEWLRLNPQWEVNTCESIEFNESIGGVNPSKMFYYQHSRYNHSFIRGLRLWLKMFPPGRERVQKIGYVNLVPGTEIPGGMFTFPRFETLDNVLLKFNNDSRMTPLPGRILTIETQEMKINSDSAVDPDRCQWYEYGPMFTAFVYILRIFYEVGDPSYQEIGITDFIPGILGTTCFGMDTYRESYSALFEKASRWCSSQYDIRICNMQSLKTKIQSGVNNRTMSYTHSGGWRTPNLRILRVAYIRQQSLDYASSIQFSYKTFVPKLLTQASITNCFQPSFEYLQETMQRVSSWVQANGADVLNVETCAMPLKQDGAYFSSEKTYYWEPYGAMYNFFIIRVYLKGSYNESPEDTTSTPYFSFRGVCILLSIMFGFPILLLLLFFILFFSLR